MKRLFTLLCLSVLTGVANAQPTRIIATNFAYHDGTAMKPYDSTIIQYLPGNTNIADARDYDYINVKWDTLSRMVYFGSAYQNFERRIYHFNSAGLKDTFLLQKPMPAGTGPWTNSEKYAYIYNANKDEIEQIGWQWNTGTNKWDSSYRAYKTYTGTNLTELREQAYYGAWQNTNRRLYAYTGSNMTQYDYELWDVGTSAWKPYSRQVQTYDANGNNDTLRFTNWNTGTGSYVNSSMATYTYNSAKMQTGYNHYQWDVPGSKWQNWLKNIYVYNASNVKTSDTSFTWNNSTLVYDRVTAGAFTYNAATLNDTIYTRAWNAATSTYKDDVRAVLEYNANKQMTVWRTQSKDLAGNWIFGKSGDRDYRYYYTFAPVGITKTTITQTTINIYPNPATNYINVEVGNMTEPCTIAIYDMTGVLVKQWEERSGSTTRSIPVADLNAGNYVLTVKNATQRSTAQFVITR